MHLIKVTWMENFRNFVMFLIGEKLPKKMRRQKYILEKEISLNKLNYQK